MTCNNYRSYFLGEMSEQEFRDHRGLCDECREAYELDILIEDEARKIPSPAPSPWLWTRISARLKGSEEDGATGYMRRIADILINPRRYAVAKVCSFIFLAAIVSYLFYLRPTAEKVIPRNILASELLQKVEEQEREYIEAIEELEEIVSPELARTDDDLLLLYRQRLETIDSQISRCRDALAADRANAHKRRYLLAAYHDKQETLNEVIDHMSGRKKRTERTIM